MEQARWRVVLAVTIALARTHLRIIVLIVLVQTLIAIIFVFKVLVLESLSGEEVDRAE